MSQEVRNAALKEKTKTLLEGPLKHIRGAALAATLLPLASIAAAPASAQEMCGSGGNVCGFVWNDANQNGIQDAGETGIEGVTLTLIDGTTELTAETGPDGFFVFNGFVSNGLHTIEVSLLSPVLKGMQPSPADQEGDDSVDSDGVVSGLVSHATVNVSGLDNHDTDFGFFGQAPGTGTPGYWKNHPDAWPVENITVGNDTYTKAQAIYWLGRVGKDKTTTMFSSLVSAMLNLMVGNPGVCLTQGQTNAIASANTWMANYGPVGKGVAASSPAWAEGEPIHKYLDAYNNGQLCDPHRN
jgi:SdrD B-like domain